MIVITTTENTRTNNNRPDTDLYADMPPQGRGRSGRTRPRTDEQGERRPLRRQAPVGAGHSGRTRPRTDEEEEGASLRRRSPRRGSRRGRARGPPTATSATSTPTTTSWHPPRPSPAQSLEDLPRKLPRPNPDHPPPRTTTSTPLQHPSDARGLTEATPEAVPCAHNEPRTCDRSKDKPREPNHCLDQHLVLYYTRTKNRLRFSVSPARTAVVE